MKLTKQKICVKNTEEARRVLQEFGEKFLNLQDLIDDGYKYIRTGYNGDWSGYDYIPYTNLLINTKQLRDLLESKDVQFLDGNDVGN